LRPDRRFLLPAQLAAASKEPLECCKQPRRVSSRTHTWRSMPARAHTSELLSPQSANANRRLVDGGERFGLSRSKPTSQVTQTCEESGHASSLRRQREQLRNLRRRVKLPRGCMPRWYCSTARQRLNLFPLELRSANCKCGHAGGTGRSQDVGDVISRRKKKVPNCMCHPACTTAG